MKYMGHKGKLLPVLGEILLHEARDAASIADPFCGSGAVSWYLATQSDKSIISGDLQAFAVARAASVIERTVPVDARLLFNNWILRAERVVDRITDCFPRADAWLETTEMETAEIKDLVYRSRKFCEEVLPNILSELGEPFPMSRAYGGYYFSPMQSIQLDALRQTLPDNADQRRVALAALIETASRCAAAPGHTAQPFQPTSSASKFIIEAWNRDVIGILRQAVDSISPTFAQSAGRATTGDFEHSIAVLQEGDLVFADPPYSDVHYSRFYHVLETIARGNEVEVTGQGRYPPFIQRPASDFSRKSQSFNAARKLIESCIQKRVNLVLTFPSSGASNGLTANDFVDLGRRGFSSIEVSDVYSTFSTLGGNAESRGGRKECIESIVCFRH